MLLSPCRRITLGRLRMVGLSSLLMRLEGEIRNWQPGPPVELEGSPLKRGLRDAASYTGRNSM